MIKMNFSQLKKFMSDGLIQPRRASIGGLQGESWKFNPIGFLPIIFLGSDQLSSKSLKMNFWNMKKFISDGFNRFW